MDLCYTRKSNKKESMPVYDFLSACQKKLLSTSYKSDLGNNNDGLILRIGNRRSLRCSRIYEKPYGLRFEFEIKYRAIEAYTEIFFQKKWDIFEEKLSSEFLTYFTIRIFLESSYVDWLVPTPRQGAPRSW